MNRLSEKEKGFIKDIVKGETGTQAALNNYDTTDENVAAVIASENIRKPKIQNAIKSIADRIPDELLEKVHKEGLEANRIISANITYGEADEKTNDFIEVPDHATRHRFLDSAYKLKGSYAPDKVLNANINVEFSSEIDEMAKEVALKIKEKRLNEKKD